MMKKQIKKLADLIVESGDVADNVVKWIFDNMSKSDMKLFLRYINNAERQKTAVVKYAGDLTEAAKNKIYGKFPGKRIVFVRRDEEIGAGIKINFGDYSLDYTVSGMIEKIMKDIRENL